MTCVGSPLPLKSCCYLQFYICIQMWSDAYLPGRRVLCPHGCPNVPQSSITFLWSSRPGRSTLQVDASSAITADLRILYALFPNCDVENLGRVLQHSGRLTLAVRNVETTLGFHEDARWLSGEALDWLRGAIPDRTGAEFTVDWSQSGDLLQVLASRLPPAPTAWTLSLDKLKPPTADTLSIVRTMASRLDPCWDRQTARLPPPRPLRVPMVDASLQVILPSAPKRSRLNGLANWLGARRLRARPLVRATAQEIPPAGSQEGNNDIVQTEEEKIEDRRNDPASLFDSDVEMEEMEAEVGSPQVTEEDEAMDLQLAIEASIAPIIRQRALSSPRKFRLYDDGADPYQLEYGEDTAGNSGGNAESSGSATHGLRPLDSTPDPEAMIRDEDDADLELQYATHASVEQGRASPGKYHMCRCTAAAHHFVPIAGPSSIGTGAQKMMQKAKRFIKSLLPGGDSYDSDAVCPEYRIRWFTQFMKMLQEVSSAEKINKVVKKGKKKTVLQKYYPGKEKGQTAANEKKSKGKGKGKEKETEVKKKEKKKAVLKKAVVKPDTKKKQPECEYPGCHGNAGEAHFFLLCYDHSIRCDSSIGAGNKSAEKYKEWISDVHEVVAAFPGTTCADLGCKSYPKALRFDQGTVQCRSCRLIYAHWWARQPVAITSQHRTKEIGVIWYLNNQIPLTSVCAVPPCNETPATNKKGKNSNRRFKRAPDGSGEVLCPPHATSLHKFCLLRDKEPIDVYSTWKKATTLAIENVAVVGFFRQLRVYEDSQCCIDGCNIRWPEYTDLAYRFKTPDPDYEGHICYYCVHAFWSTQECGYHQRPRNSDVTPTQIAAFTQFRLTYEPDIARREGTIQKLAVTRELVKIARDAGTTACPGKCTRDISKGKVYAVTPWGCDKAELFCVPCGERVFVNSRPDIAPSNIAKRRWNFIVLHAATQYVDVEFVDFARMVVIVVLIAKLQKHWLRCRVSHEYHTLSIGAHRYFRLNIEHHRLRGLRDICAAWVNHAKIALDELEKQMGADEARKRLLWMISPTGGVDFKVNPEFKILEGRWKAIVEDVGEGRRESNFPATWTAESQQVLPQRYRQELARANTPFPAGVPLHHDHVDGGPLCETSDAINGSSGSKMHRAKYRERCTNAARDWVPRLGDATKADPALVPLVDAIVADPKCAPVIKEAKKAFDLGIPDFGKYDEVGVIMDAEAHLLVNLASEIMSAEILDAHPMTAQDFREVVVENAPGRTERPMIASTVRSRGTASYGSWQGLSSGLYEIPGWEDVAEEKVDINEGEILDLDDEARLMEEEGEGEGEGGKTLTRKTRWTSNFDSAMRLISVLTSEFPYILGSASRFEVGESGVSGGWNANCLVVPSDTVEDITAM
ncbi:hypothetical protein DFH06DRAFT_1118571 [Mycena polygramma]|nr:hypothetical protein DFH06DRAFT_1118571 [Mycena polygramma]